MLSVPQSTSCDAFCLTLLSRLLLEHLFVPPFFLPLNFLLICLETALCGQPASLARTIGPLLFLWMVLMTVFTADLSNPRSSSRLHIDQDWGSLLVRWFSSSVDIIWISVITVLQCLLWGLCSKMTHNGWNPQSRTIGCKTPHFTFCTVFSDRHKPFHTFLSNPYPNPNSQSLNLCRK